MTLKIGDLIELNITGYTHDGAGVGRKENQVIFVPGVMKDETVLVEIVEKKKSFLQGRLRNILEKNEERIKPKCTVFEDCGGCQLQHVNYKTQLNIKRQVVQDILKRIGGFNNIEIKPTIGMDNPWHYRNKGHFQVKRVDGYIRLGFFEEGTYNITDTYCQYLFSPEVTKLLGFIEDIFNQYQVKLSQGREKGLKNLLIRESSTNEDILIVFVVTGDFTDKKEQIAREICKNFPQVVGVCQNVNNQGKGIILGNKTQIILGENKIKDQIGPYIFNISPVSFFQVNAVQTEKLYEKVLAYSELTGEETVIDAYCGIGTISLFLAKKAKKVIGIEIVEDAVKDARINAQENGVTNVEFHCGKVESLLPDMTKAGLRPDIVVVDPPRKGCDRSLINCLLEVKPAKIVYVSCNPSTLARDMKLLGEGGYVHEVVQPIDMFPQTGHVECVVGIQRK